MCIRDRFNIAEESLRESFLAASLRTGKIAFSNEIHPDPIMQNLREIVEWHDIHSSAAVPLLSDEKVVGLLSLSAADKDFFECLEEQDLLEEISEDISFAVKTLELESKRERTQSALIESEDRFKTFFEASPDAVFIVDKDGQFLDVNPVVIERYGYSREEIANLTVNDIIMPEIKRQVSGIFRKPLVKGTLPIVWHGKRRDGSIISEEAILRSFTLQGQPCIFVSIRDITERVQAQQKIKLQLQRMSALHTIDKMITSTVDLRPTLNVLLNQVTSLLNVDAAAILLLDENKHSLEFSAGVGFKIRVPQSLYLRLGEGFAGKAALERRIIHIDNLFEAGGETAPAILASVGPFAAYYGVPLIAKGLVKGVLEIYHKTTLNPDQEWLDFLETIADQAAIAIDNIQMFDSLQRSNTELKLAYDITIEGWSRAMDLRDKETEGHTQRVTEKTIQMAQAAGLSKEQIVHIRRGALLHDIGKLGVPDAILLKPVALNEEEWAIMRKHPEYAYEMLSSIEYLRPALDIPYCHHERWDGTGYPRGLKNKQIPIAARLFAVVDVWDALRSDRPYRAGWPEEKVLEHIRNQSGTHFDPAIVDIFFSVMGETPHNPQGSTEITD
jgi:PAS domain S-box-containing protein